MKKAKKIFLLTTLISVFVFSMFTLTAYCSQDSKITFDTINCLKKSDIDLGTIVKTSGYLSANDGQGATYIITDTPSMPIDDKNVVMIQNGKFAQVITEIPSTSGSTLREYHQEDPYGAQIMQLRNSFSPSTILYFSNSGSDTNDGLSPSSPKQNPVPYINAGNCQCLLKSGEIFKFKSTLSIGSNTILSTYGGTKRAGLSFIQSSNSALQPVVGTEDLFFVDLNSNDSDTGWISIDGQVNWKRKLDPNLSNDNEYYIDKTSAILYIKSTSNLSGKKVSYAYSGHGLKIANGQNVVVENMEISGAGSHGIDILFESNVLITNCYIHEIGGTMHPSVTAKYGNGIQIWANSCNNIGIYKNIITDCFDAGLTAQIDNSQKAPSANLFFLNNLVERCNYGFESFHSSQNYPMQNLVISNNVFHNIKDITNGYRLTQSSTKFTAFLCLWDYNNSNSSLIIDHNFGFRSQTNAISYSPKSAVIPPITFLNNTLITSTNAIYNSGQYTGDNLQYIIVNTNTTEYFEYEKLANNLISSYTKNTLIK